MKRGISLVLLLVLLSLSVSLIAKDNNHGAAYIRMGVGAKELAMGSAVTASVDNVTAAYWNPAGLSNLKGMELASMYSVDMGLDRTYNYAGFGIRFNLGAVALNWINMNVEDIQGYNADGEPTDSFDNGEHNLSLSYATAPGKFKFGFSAKMYMSDIDDEQENGYGFDAGAIFDVNQYISFGVMLRDIYSELNEEEIPTEYSIGTAIYPFKGITLTSDLRREKHSDKNKISFGGEYWAGLGNDVEVNSQLSGITMEEATKWEEIMSSTSAGVRFGVNDGNFTGGAGLRFKMFEVDYAFTTEDLDIFNDSHRLSLLIRF